MAAVACRWSFPTRSEGEEDAIWLYITTDALAAGGRTLARSCTASDATQISAQNAKGRDGSPTARNTNVALVAARKSMTMTPLRKLSQRRRTQGTETADRWQGKTGLPHVHCVRQPRWRLSGCHAVVVFPALDIFRWRIYACFSYSRLSGPKLRGRSSSSVISL